MIAGAAALIMPSYYESLSMVALEAWALGTPVIANAQCDVLLGQCLRSNAGLYYANAAEFGAVLDTMLDDRALAERLGSNGRRYYEQHYSWPVIERKYLDMFAAAVVESAAAPDGEAAWLARRQRALRPAAQVAGRTAVRTGRRLDRDLNDPRAAAGRSHESSRSSHRVTAARSSRRRACLPSARRAVEPAARRRSADDRARDRRTWKNEYGEGADRIRGVLVRRFAVNQPHDATAFRQFSESHPRGAALARRGDGLGAPARAVGAGLVEHLKRQHRSYDALVFFSLHPLDDRSWNGRRAGTQHPVSCLRLESGAAFALWPDASRRRVRSAYVSGAERQLLRALSWRVTVTREELVGIGIEPSHRQAYPRHQQDPADEPVADDEASAQADAAPSRMTNRADRGVPFRRRHRLYGPIVAVRRPRRAGQRLRGDARILRHLCRDATATPSLVLMGVKMMKRARRAVPAAGRRAARSRAHGRVRSRGRDDRARPPTIRLRCRCSKASPSARRCWRARATMRRSNTAAAADGGLYYANRDEFVEALRMLMTRSQAARAARRERTPVRPAALPLGSGAGAI